MAWNGSTPNAPNWAGVDSTSSGGSNVGDLYIVPDPPTTATNPSIGLEERNEVELPRAYRDFAVQNLTATNITATNINGNPNFDASNWSLYRAISDVRGTLGAFSIPQYSIADFFDITCANNITAQLGSVVAGVNVSAGVQVSAPVGGFNQVTAEDINVSFSDETADVNIYGANLLAGDNALYVEGGTTLTGGGIVHGVTIGALQVGGIDTVRIDVLPVGMTLTSATFIATTAAGAASLVAGGALALAGGDYITYNSDEHRFINTTAGNDYTDIFVGNIHAAYTGSLPLRINDVGRGVQLANVKSIDLWTEQPPLWVNSTLYTTGQKVGYLNVYYTCLADNAYTQPNIPIPNWVSASNYITGTIVFSSPYAFRCTSSISGSTTPPNPTSDPNWLNLGLLTNDITQIWQVYSPYASYILGDDLSTVNVGTVGANAMATDVLGGKTDPYLINVNASIIADAGVRVINEFNSIQLKGKVGYDATLGFMNSSSSLSTIKQVNSTGEVVITTAGGLTIDTNTSTDFSAGDVVNLKNLTLTSALNPTWSDITTYALNAMVERDGYNWRSEIAGNVGNIPQALLAPWLLSSSYVIGNVRYDVGANNSYLCIANISGSTTPPSADPTNWSFFQVGSNAEDVWYQMNPTVESNIVGDRLSSIEIGTQDFVCEAGTYLTIGQDINQLGTIDATVATGGSITLVGVDNATLGALTGTVGIVGDSVYIQTIPTTGGSILVEANDELALGAINDAQLASTTGNVLVSSLAGNITLNSADLLTLAGVNNVAIGSTSADVNITSEVSTNINATTGAINIGSALETSITAGDYINIQADENVDVIANTGTIAITGATDTTITATAGDLSLVAGTDVNITAGATGKVIVNSTLDLTDKNIINADTITGQGALTLATTGATNLNLSPDTGGLIVANKGLNMSNNNITNANTITGQTALSLTAANGAVNIAATGTGNRILLNSDTSLGNRTLFNFTGTNVGGIFGLTTQPLNLVGQQTTPAVTIRGSLTMWQNATTQGSGNSISGVTTLNGRNIFSYGNFYNTASQTLGAINTATRIQMNTSANNNLITLDTTTNIGRLTFTNAGVYNVSWNGYLLHGGGGATNSYIWIRLNGVDVAGSAKKQRCDAGLNDVGISSASLVNATAGQYIEFFWSADGTNVPLTAIAAAAPVPAIPSFSCTIEIVG